MLEEFSLDGKRALITGGSTGLGRAMGLVLAEAGADVAISARRLENLRVAEEEISQHGHKVVSIAADVSDSAAVDAMVSEATEALGGIDILINNAGRADDGPVAALPEQPGPNVSNEPGATRVIRCSSPAAISTKVSPGGNGGTLCWP